VRRRSSSLTNTAEYVANKWNWANRVTDIFHDLAFLVDDFAQSFQQAVCHVGSFVVGLLSNVGHFVQMEFANKEVQRFLSQNVGNFASDSFHNGFLDFDPISFFFKKNPRPSEAEHHGKGHGGREERL
jgi:hypothetical protein